MFPAIVGRFLSVERFGGNDPRWWVRLGVPRPDAEGLHRRPIRLVIEVDGFGPRAGLKYSRDEDHTLFVGLGWSLYVSWDSRKPDEGREWGVSLWGEHLTLRWACDDSEMHYDGKGGHGRPRCGWYRSWFLMDCLFGQRDYRSVEVKRQTRPLVMPEGEYRADCTITLDTWTRSRWPWWPLTRQLRRARVKFDPPVGIPGKGENAYDIDDDATYELTTPLKDGSLAATLEAFAIDTLRERQRRGGLTWAPREGWPASVAAD